MSPSSEAQRWYAEELLKAAAAAGFYACGILSVSEWSRVLNALGRTEQLLEHYHLDEAGAILVAALRYAPDASPEPQEQRSARGLPPLPLLQESAADSSLPAFTAAVARFARADWYREILNRFSRCVNEVSAEAGRRGLPAFPAKRWRRFANSHFPEKALAVAAGLGSIGRNSLLIAHAGTPAGTLAGTPAGKPVADQTNGPAWSSAVLLGLLMLPFDVDNTQNAQGMLHRDPYPPLARCALCARCIEVCPSGALARAESPLFDRTRCIQHYAGMEGVLPDHMASAWRNQLYGCDICLEACPYFIPDPDASCIQGRIGAYLDARALAVMEASYLRMLFRGSALDQKWISCTALIRNAALIASRASLSAASARGPLSAGASCDLGVSDASGSSSPS